MGLMQSIMEHERKVAEATKVLLIPESNLDRNDPESLITNNDENQ